MEEPWTICQGSGSESLFCHYPNDLGVRERCGWVEGLLHSSSLGGRERSMIQHGARMPLDGEDLGGTVGIREKKKKRETG